MRILPLFRRALHSWLALELVAGILALDLLVAVGPLVAVLLARPEFPGPAAAAVLAVSIPAAALLATAALKLSRELLASGSHRAG